MSDDPKQGPDLGPDDVDANGVQRRSVLSTDGRFEYPDPVPMSPPIGYQEGYSLEQMVRDMIRRQVSQAAAEADMETFEEADDFDIEDDPIDPLTEYEKVFEPKDKGTKPVMVPPPVSPPQVATEVDAGGGTPPEGSSPPPVKPAPPPTTSGDGTVHST